MLKLIFAHAKLGNGQEIEKDKIIEFPQDLDGQNCAKNCQADNFQAIAQCARVVFAFKNW